nr:1-phosphatidylinositol 4,5-bisphosphate phosphodiesterase zeta-1-like [Oncorhynchus nerka]
MTVKLSRQNALLQVQRHQSDMTKTGTRENRSMTFEGFYRYMESKDCSVFDQIHTSVYQDMDQPLCHYFISSSHNTYLTGDQLVGKSTLDAYVRPLRETILCQVSPYPVILSLENHCTPTQQDVMAQYLTSILGEKLLATSLDLTNQPGQLPSPNSEGEDSEEEDEDDDEEEEPNLKTKHHSKLKRKKVIAESLSNLVVYTKSVKFHSFSHAREHQQYYENTSLGEKKAHKLVKTSAPDFVQHNMVFITRIYPAASRTLSSNYNPQGFWNVGSQMVALNFQSLGLPMDLNNGRFQDNGGCGYVLKPLFLRTNQWGFNPNSYRHNLKPAHLLLKVISGSNLPVPRSGKALDPFVRVEIHSVHSDSCRRHTDTVRHNSLSPRWDSAMNFTISVPDLSLIRFTVRDQTGLTSEFIGQYTIPFISMKKGYRWVPLLSREGYSLDPASLFIFIWYS